MSGSHVTRELLQGIFDGERPPRDLISATMAHLFELCPQCQAVLEAFHQGEEEPGVDYSSAYERALAHLFAAETQLERERLAADRRFAELLKVPLDAGLERVQESPERFEGPFLAELLLHESREKLPERPRESYTLAQLGRAVLQHSPPSALVIELYVRALAYMANALRVMGQVREAAERFDHSRFLYRSHGGGDQLLAAELDHLEGSLRRAQRRLPEAIALLSRAVMTYREEGRTVPAARALLTLAMTCREQGDLERATLLARESLQTLDSRDEPRLYLMAHHNMAWLLQEAGHFHEAREMLAAGRELYSQFPDAWTQLRRRWLEGQIARGLGDAAAAEQAFQAVREGFLRKGSGYDAALASLDLALLYLEQQRPADVKRVAEEIVPVFEAQDVHREALAALMLFQDAARLEQLTHHFVHKLASYLEAARRNPALPFCKPC